jgi:hypothetical protein
MKDNKALLAMLAHAMEVFKEGESFDEDDYEDDDETDDEGCDFDLSALSSFCEGAVSAVATRGSDEKVVNVGSGGIDMVMDNLTKEPGVTSVVARPGSGKTNVGPARAAQQGIPSVVVVPNETTAAGAAVFGDGRTVVSKGETIGDRDDLQYVTASEFVASIEKGIVPVPGHRIFIDEAQDKSNSDVMKAIALGAGLSDTNPVVKLYSTLVGSQNLVPPGVVCDTIEAFKYNECSGKRCLVVHQNKFMMRRDFSMYGGFLLGQGLVKDAEVLKTLHDRPSYILHTTYQQTIGLNLPLDVVRGPSNISSGGLVRGLLVSEHMQLANRLGRFGQSGGKYYGMRDLENRVVRDPEMTAMMAAARNKKKKKKEVDVTSNFNSNAVNERLRSILETDVQRYRMNVSPPKDTSAISKWAFVTNIDGKEISGDEGEFCYPPKDIEPKIRRIRVKKDLDEVVGLIIHNRNFLLGKFWDAIREKEKVDDRVYRELELLRSYVKRIQGYSKWFGHKIEGVDVFGRRVDDPGELWF